MGIREYKTMKSRKYKCEWDARSYKCEWDARSYGDVKPEIVWFDFFTDDLGYDDDDREQINELRINQSVLLGMSDHKITRIS